MDNSKIVLDTIDNNKEKFQDSEYILLMDTLKNIYESKPYKIKNDYNFLMRSYLEKYEQEYYNANHKYPTKDYILNNFRYVNELNLKETYIALSNPN